MQRSQGRTKYTDMQSISTQKPDASREDTKVHCDDESPGSFSSSSPSVSFSLANER